MTPRHARRLAVVGMLVATFPGSGCGAEEPGGTTDRPGTSAPQVEWWSPAFASTHAVACDLVQVQFAVPVSGVTVEDLTVNDAPAARVTREPHNAEKEPLYVFSGFPEPALGPVEVRLAAGRIRRLPSGTPFKGFSWRFELLNPTADDDRDGLTNARELELYTNPGSADTDQDGMPDVFEATQRCLDPASDQRYVMTFTGERLPGDDDADDDGRSDLTEFQQGTDPCAP